MLIKKVLLCFRSKPFEPAHDMPVSGSILFFALATFLGLFFSMHALNAIVPRATLTHFEKDLQTMAKSSKMPVIKEGSFVHRLAGKRRQKEVIEQALAELQQEVDQLQQDVARLEALSHEIEQTLQQVHEKMAQQKIIAQHVTMQLECEQAALRTVTT